MSTTSVFVEILIVGLQAMIWVGLIVFAKYAGHDKCLAALTKYEQYSALITTLLLASAYVLGIFVDRVADCVYVLFQYRDPEKPPARVAEMRLQIMHQSEGMAKFLDYQRSRLRIARATVFNLFVTLVVLSCTSRKLLNRDPHEAAPIIVLMTVGLVVLLIITRRIDQAQISRLRQAYKIITPIKGTNDMSKSRQVVAAVCHRRKKKNETEFLLVRTKGGKYWTFPKGKVKDDKNEPPWHAAHREATEEAGVSYSESIKRKPFTSYKYRKGGKTKEHKIDAYLMRVKSKLGSCEPGRSPQWFTQEKAMEKFKEGGREEKYVLEHQQVIQEAVKLLGQE